MMLFSATGMLLLSENVPRPSQDGAAANPSAPWDESTQSWYLVGHAVRTGYLLGLDQVRSTLPRDLKDETNR